MLWYSLEAPRRGASNEYPQHMFLWRNKKALSSTDQHTHYIAVSKISVDVLQTVVPDQTPHSLASEIGLLRCGLSCLSDYLG